MPQALSPESKLQIISEHYLEDETYFKTHNDGDIERRKSIAEVQKVIAAFVAKQIAIAEFRDQLQDHLMKLDVFGLKGPWLMTLNQLVAHHGQPGEKALREALDGLSAQNVGRRIEEFRSFLQNERTRLKGTGNPNRLAAPGKAPFFISIFALCTDPDGDVVVSWPSLREGLAFLREIRAIPLSNGPVPSDDVLRMLSASDYGAVKATIDSVAASVPQLKGLVGWWDERFLDWVRLHKSAIRGWIDNEGGTVIDPPLDDTFDDTALLRIEPTVLQQQIRTLQRELLVPEELIRRIYHTLVLGQHIILSGPPGTGKTELARLLPRELWMGEEDGPPATTAFTVSGSPLAKVPTTTTTYTARVVTATDEWTPRHVIGGITPITDNQQIRYEIAYGCLAHTIMDNWKLDGSDPGGWPSAKRRKILELNGASEHQYRGRWLVIDEFNRAPIDLALGDAMTALGGSIRTLNVPTEKGTAELPIPKDFRIIGTLNTFDRHFLNQISEALKRRFAFIEVLPPARAERDAEQAMVLRKALERLAPLSGARITSDQNGGSWNNVLQVRIGDEAPWEHDWQGDTAVQRAFAAGWRLFEVIRLYRQFGTAQAIAWTVNFLGAGLLDDLEPSDDIGWRARLDAAFADTLADQLQILFPDEVEVLLAYLRTDDAGSFATQYNRMLADLASMKRRNAQMLALQSVKDDDENPYLPVAVAQRITADEAAEVDPAILVTLFHAGTAGQRLPRFEGRMERFLFERVL